MRLGRERILVGGETGASKTYSWLTMVRHNPDKQFVAIQMDDGIMKCLPEFPDVKVNTVGSPGNLTVIPNCITWGNFYAAVAQVAEWVSKGILNETSWVITEAQDMVSTRIRHEMADAKNTGLSSTAVSNSELQPSSWTQFLDKRMKDHPILQPADYDAIYTELEKPLVYLTMQMPCNLYMTSGMEPLRTSGQYQDQPDVKAFYLALGMTSKYNCYKYIPRWMDTLIEMGRDVKGAYNFKVWKDRGNPVSAQPMANRDFWQDFFVNVAGYGR